MKTRKIILTIGIILVVLVVAGFITKEIINNITEKITRDITEREVARITQDQVGKITQEGIEQITPEETEKITREIMGERTRDILGSSSDETEEFVCDLAPTQRQFAHTPYYTGPLIDNHLHMPAFSSIVSMIAIQSGWEDMPAFDQKLSSDFLICLLDSEGIQKSFGFYLAPKPVLSSMVNGVKQIHQRHPDKIVAFYMPMPIPSIDPTTAEAEEILNENPGLFQGIGEVKFDFNEVENDLPEDSKYLEKYLLADQHNLIIMMHPRKDQLDAVERLLKKHPTVPFLLHGVEVVRHDVGRLMNSYPNLYYSIDAELTSIYGWQASHQQQGPSKEEYLAYMRTNFNSKLQQSVEEWKVLIEDHPDQFLWGTDRFARWHFDYKVGSVIEEMGRSFIGKLDPAVQEKFAYKNTERLLRER